MAKRFNRKTGKKMKKAEKLLKRKRHFCTCEEPMPESILGQCKDCGAPIDSLGVDCVGAKAEADYVDEDMEIGEYCDRCWHKHYYMNMKNKLMNGLSRCGAYVETVLKTGYCGECGEHGVCLELPIYRGLDHDVLWGHALLCEKCSDVWPPDA